jgi:hypothetical protein
MVDRFNWTNRSDCCFRRDSYWYLAISISGNSSNSTNIIGAVPVIYSTTQGTSYQQSVQILEKTRVVVRGGVMSAAPRLAPLAKCCCFKYSHGKVVELEYLIIGHRL